MDSIVSNLRKFKYHRHMNKVIFSGIKPTGKLHLGNYLGAIKHWVASQENENNIFCLVDLHAITVDQDPKELKSNTIELAKLLVACGIDPSKSLLFVQSHNPDHANLGWILNCCLSMGQMNRMTQYKEKSEGRDFVSVGLFDYPALMAADILLYDTTDVPVGEDQKQHVELTRDVAERFNNKYGETFILPNPVIAKVGSRIMSLSDPSKKMSKSINDPNGTIDLLDSPEMITKKIMGATTDSDNKIIYNEKGGGISNLMEIYGEFTGHSIKDIEKEFEGQGYGDFKKAVAKIIVEELSLIKNKFESISDQEIYDILHHGAHHAFDLSHSKLTEVYEKIGFITHSHE